MKKKTTILALLGLMALGIVAAGASAFGWGGLADTDARQAMIDAVEAEDYTAWKAAHESALTEENFEQMVERHNSRIAMREAREARRDAIESGDYDAYVEAAESIGKAGTLSEEDFNTLVEIHAQRAADGETLLGLGNRLGMGEGLGQGFGKGLCAEEGSGRMGGFGRGMQ